MVLAREELLVDISQRLGVMRAQEASNYAVPDYLAAEWQQKLRDATVLDDNDDGSSQQPMPSSGEGNLPAAGVAVRSSSQFNELWREKICEWFYGVVDHFDFNREYVSVAMSYLDRYLASRTVNRRVFQLAAMTALYIAIKLFQPGKLRISSLIDLSRGYFTHDHIVVMEESMLHCLDWHVNPPTSFAFCRDLMRLVSGDVHPRVRHDIYELSRFLTELSVCDYWFATKKPSSIAVASIINAIELQGSCRVDSRYKVEFIHRVVDIGIDIADDDAVIECYERLREMYIAGGYTPNLDDRRPMGEGRSGAMSDNPMAMERIEPDEDDRNGEANVPPAVEDAGVPLAAARAVSPNAVIPESPGSGKRKTQSSSRKAQAKRPKKNLNRELDAEADLDDDDLSQMECDV